MKVEDILGINNNWLDYLAVLLIYGLMWLLIRYPKPAIELNFQNSYLLLVLFWGPLMFIGNYLGYLSGVMSFLPWLNNFTHSFIWVGLGLGWLYYCTKEQSMITQIIFASWTSFIVKIFEHLILGTWSMPVFLGIHWPYAYIIAMSLLDGLYPVLSLVLLKVFKTR